MLEEDLEVPRAVRDLVGRKEAGALATVRSLGLARLVSTDADFEKAPEWRTPRGLLLDLRRRPAAGEK